MSDYLHVSVAASRAAVQAAPVAHDASMPSESAAPQANDSALQGVSLVDATAAISSGRGLVANYVMGSNSKLAQIRVIDPTTNEVIAESPPDSIARMQQEVLAYQGVANQSRATIDT